MIGEVWRIPESFPYVIVSRDGVVKRPDGSIVYQYRSGAGYLRVRVRRHGLFHRAYVHRLVGECFVPRPEGKAEINHKNGDKHDNRAENLEWVTRSENLRHAYATGLCVVTERQRENGRIQALRYHEMRRRLKA